MVLFYKSNEGYVIYMGADKYENEDLIRYGIPEDIWFHVDGLSSAHVYLRLNANQRLEDVSADTIMECAQFVKANSIEGCKLKETYVEVQYNSHHHFIITKKKYRILVYTRWRNLKKTSDMEVGSIGFHDGSKVKSMLVVKDKEIIKRIEKTKDERFPNLAEQQEERARQFREELKQQKRAEMMHDKQAKKEREKEKIKKSYGDVMFDHNMKSNTDFEATVDDSAAKDFEDDFM